MSQSHRSGIFNVGPIQRPVGHPKLELHDSREDDEIEDVTMITDDQWYHLTTFITSFNLPQAERDEWVEQVKMGRIDALNGIELLKSDWIEHFEFLDYGGAQDWKDDNRSWVMTALKVAAKSQSATRDDTSTEKIFLPRLKCIKTNYYDTENGLSFTDILPFATLSSVETLEVFALSDESEETSFSNLLIPVKELRFPYSAVTGKALGGFIAQCPHLEVLEYVAGGSCVGFAALVPEDLGLSLQACKRTLRRLSIDDMEGWSVDWCEGPHGLEKYYRPICSFKDFSLEELSLMSSMLVGLHVPENPEMDYSSRFTLVQSLPMKLRHLTLKLCDISIISQLHELEIAFQETVSCLESLCIVFKESLGQREEEWKDVVSRFEARGVAVQFKINDHPKSVRHSVTMVNGTNQQVASIF